MNALSGPRSVDRRFGAELAARMAASQIGVRALARRSGYTASYISQLRAGLRQPSADAAQDLDDALAGGGELAVFAQDRPRRPSTRSLADAFTLAMTDAPAGGDAPIEEEDVDRRAFNIAALGLLTGSLLPPGPVPRAVTATDARRLREANAGIWAEERTIGGSALLRTVVQRYTAVRAMLDHSSYPSSVGLELQSIAAELAACAGFTAFDAGVPALARGLLQEAAFLSGSTGDPMLTAHAYALLAMQATALSVRTRRPGPAREAMRFLGQAADTARHEPSPRMHATISMRQATAAALLGDTVEARRNITLARRELDRGDHPSDPAWAGFVSPSEITAHEAMAAYLLGNAEIAARLFRDVLGDAGLPSRNRALYQARLAMALHAAGDKTEAVTVALDVLPVLQGPVRSARALQQLQPVRRDADPGSEFAARFDAAASSAAYAAAS